SSSFVVQKWVSTHFPSSNPSPSPQSSSVQSQPSTLPQSTTLRNLELLEMASTGFDPAALEIGAKVLRE
ncbi:hypothetical protein NC651_007134, partial [Populus alba x Populus x berolinensis]